MDKEAAADEEATEAAEEEAAGGDGGSGACGLKRARGRRSNTGRRRAASWRSQGRERTGDGSYARDERATRETRETRERRERRAKRGKTRPGSTGLSQHALLPLGVLGTGNGASARH